jgi:hypothetical protein
MGKPFSGEAGAWKADNLHARHHFGIFLSHPGSSLPLFVHIPQYEPECVPETFFPGKAESGPATVDVHLDAPAPVHAELGEAA